MENKQLVRSTQDRMVAGVAAGLADYMNFDPTIVRLLFVLLALAGGPGLIIYLIMWVVMPEA
jgi:phage shock protein C